MILRYAYLLLGFFQAKLLFPGGRSVLVFDSCLSQLVSLCVWLLPLNSCKLAFRLSLTSQPCSNLASARCARGDLTH